MEISETIVTGRKFKKLIDKTENLWQKISFWSKAGDIEFDDGKDAETKLGAIDGITDNLDNTSSRIAASAKAVSTLNDELNRRPEFILDESGKITGYKTKEGADTVFPFSSYSGDIVQNIVPGFNPIRYTIVAPTADITWRLFGGDCYVKLDDVIKGSTPSTSQSTANGDFSAVRGQVITGVCQYPSGSYINITEHFDQTDIQRQDT